MKVYLKIFLLLVSLPGLSGWDFSNHNVSLGDIVSGGPPRDGIPAINSPRFLQAQKVEKDFLENDDRVLGLVINGVTKAYPIKILNWHEIVNDSIGDQPLVITFCPLCETGMVFDSQIKDKRMIFGVSGLLYQSDMLLYDQQTESLWSQLKQEAITGPMMGTKLKLLPSTHTTWGAWRKQYPECMVMSTETGFDRDYDRDPYESYKNSKALMFKVNSRSKAYHPKEQVLGIELEGISKAYPFVELGRSSLPVRDQIGKFPITIFYEAETNTAIIKDEKGKELPTVVGFWFAWFAFYPETQVYRADNS